MPYKYKKRKNVYRLFKALYKLKKIPAFLTKRIYRHFKITRI